MLKEYFGPLVERSIIRGTCIVCCNINKNDKIVGAAHALEHSDYSSAIPKSGISRED